MDAHKDFVALQPLGRASFFPSEAELKKSDAKVDRDDLNNRLFKYKGGRPEWFALQGSSLNDRKLDIIQACEALRQLWRTTLSTCCERR